MNKPVYNPEIYFDLTQEDLFLYSVESPDLSYQNYFIQLFIICLNYQRFGRVMLKDIFLFLMVINFYLEYAVDS